MRGSFRGIKRVLITYLGVLASGNGSNFERLAQAVLSSEIPNAQIACLVTDRECPALDRAGRLDIPFFIFKPVDFALAVEWTGAITDCLKNHKVELVLFAGFLRKIEQPLLAAYKNRILNIHPALLPGFGGKGMYGRRVHEAVIAAGVKESGVTIHVVDEQYDHGPVVWQERIPVEPTDTPETLEAKIHQLEHTAYPRAVAQYLKQMAEPA
ncbi:MAG: phosphoribosylglycinamide formyltransferase [Elusimicrobia bacterium]|nr:phosphoribosylglycinamide formyltransferase [Elusimicrobiota bacterium]